MMISDYHVHSSISPDGKASMQEMCEAAVEKGLEKVVFTEHYECYRLGVRSKYFNREYLEHYFKELEKNRERFTGKLEIGAGIELGQPHLDMQEALMVTSYPFDYILGSVHKLGNADLGWIRFTENNRLTLTETYFREVEVLSAEGIYDCIGHLDYVKKHCARCGVPYEKGRYLGIIERILKNVIARGKGIEINTSCLGSGLEETMPDAEVLQMYKDLGGTIVTFGSDAHVPERVGYMV